MKLEKLRVKWERREEKFAIKLHFKMWRITHSRAGNDGNSVKGIELWTVCFEEGSREGRKKQIVRDSKEGDAELLHFTEK